MSSSERFMLTFANMTTSGNDNNYFLPYMGVKVVYGNSPHTYQDANLDDSTS